MDAHERHDQEGLSMFQSSKVFTEYLLPITMKALTIFVALFACSPLLAQSSEDRDKFSEYDMKTLYNETWGLGVGYTGYGSFVGNDQLGLLQGLGSTNGRLEDNGLYTDGVMFYVGGAYTRLSVYITTGSKDLRGTATIKKSLYSLEELCRNQVIFQIDSPIPLLSESLWLTPGIGIGTQNTWVDLVVSPENQVPANDQSLTLVLHRVQIQPSIKVELGISPMTVWFGAGYGINATGKWCDDDSGEDIGFSPDPETGVNLSFGASVDLIGWWIRGIQDILN